MKLIWLLLHNLGESRGFAFVEFSSIDEAREWIEAEQVYTYTCNHKISSPGTRKDKNYASYKFQSFMGSLAGECITNKNMPSFICNFYQANMLGPGQYFTISRDFFLCIFKCFYPIFSPCGVLFLTLWGTSLPFLN